MAGGKLRDRNTKESWALLEDLALYDNESWNDPRDFAKLVKAISLPQDVPMNKVTSSCEICIGPHDTRYCMENPEQAFVEYASSRIDEAGGPNMDDEGIEWLDVEEPLDLDQKGEDDYDRGCRKPSYLEDRFYRDTIKLEPEYVTRMDDEGEVMLYLMRRSLEVLRKFHWMILGGRFNQLSHISSSLLSKPEEY
ncbi:hypothetical protein Tco_1561535 [Tanacetum coccineum]